MVKLVAWKYFSVIMALMLVLGTGVVALMPGPVIATGGPTISSISPSSGKRGDLISATITGTGFIGADRVYIEDGNGDTLVSMSSGFTVNPAGTAITLSFTIPAGARPGSGVVQVRVSSVWGSLNNGFTVLGPYINNVTPSGGKPGQTLAVVITGVQLTGATAVTFSGTGVTAAITNVTATQITANVTIAVDAVIGLRSISVTTPDGTDTRSSAFRVYASSSCGWVTMTVDTVAGSVPSIALDSLGNPHIAYVDYSNHKLKYVSYDGGNWSTPETVYSGSVDYPSLAMFGDNPCISYNDITNGKLCYAWKTSTWQLPVNVDAIDASNQSSSSLALDGSGKPHISYCNNFTTNVLLFAYNHGDPATPADWTIENVGTALSRYSSLALDSSDNPHISYSRYDDVDHVGYAYKAGSDPWTTVQVNTDRTHLTSIALDSGGDPHISYVDITVSGAIKYTSRTGGVWAAPVTVGSGSNPNYNSPLALNGADNPRICYSGMNDATIKFYSGSVPDTQVVAGGPFTQIISLALNKSADKPHVAYCESYTRLKYAYYVAPVDPTVTTVAPASGAQGAANLAVVIDGTNFYDPSTITFSGDGITVNSVTFGSTTQLTANITISGVATAGARTISVATCKGTASDTFTINGTGPVTPTITNSGGATGVTATAATLNGNLTSDGGAATNVTVYWGIADGGATSGSWGNNVPLGVKAVGAFSTPLAGLTAGATYYYRCAATNSQGTSWAASSSSFVTQTAPTPPNPSMGTGAPTSHGGSTGSTTTTQQTVSLPNIQTQSASLSAKVVTPGSPITVTADIANKSAVNGSKKVTLYVNGQVELTQGITVNSGGSTKLTFNVSRSEPGDYSVYVDGVPAGSFKVEMFRESDGILIISAALVALAFMLGMVMLWRRRRTG